MTLESYNEDFGRGFLRDLGIRIVSVDPAVGRFVVTESAIAPNGYVFAAGVIALADGLAAMGTIESYPEGASN
ncbi:MAG TPA: competence protein ComA, partial [Actinomycetota bacterium]|nr:competence protein ComA [Actinomycetota bacterium]